MTMLDQAQPPEGGKPAKAKPEKKKAKVKPKDKLSVLAGKINTATGLLLVSFRSSLSHAKVVGGLCRHARTRCEAEGENFREWVEKHVKRITYAHVLNYIRLYENWKKVVAARKINPALTMTEAIKIVASGKGKGKGGGKKNGGKEEEEGKPIADLLTFAAENPFRPSPQERRGMEILLAESSLQLDPTAAIQMLWQIHVAGSEATDAGYHPEIFDTLALLAQEQDEERLSDYLTSLVDLSEQWDAAITPYAGVLADYGPDTLIAEAAIFASPKDVEAFEAKPPADGKFPDGRWDASLAINTQGNPHIEYLTRKEANLTRLARKAVEWLLGPHGGQWRAANGVDLGNEEMDELKVIVKAQRATGSPTPVPNPQPEPPTTEPEPQEERQNLPPRQLPPALERELFLDDD